MGEETEPHLYGEHYRKKMKGEAWLFGVELCPKYIEYLQKVLEPYLHD
jgi:hypothetical protein